MHHTHSLRPLATEQKKGWFQGGSSLPLAPRVCMFFICYALSLLYFLFTMFCFVLAFSWFLICYVLLCLCFALLGCNDCRCHVGILMDKWFFKNKVRALPPPPSQTRFPLRTQSEHTATACTWQTTRIIHTQRNKQRTHTENTHREQTHRLLRQLVVALIVAWMMHCRRTGHSTTTKHHSFLNQYPILFCNHPATHHTLLFQI